MFHRAPSSKPAQQLSYEMKEMGSGLKSSDEMAENAIFQDHPTNNNPIQTEPSLTINPIDETIEREQISNSDLLNKLESACHEANIRSVHRLLTDYTITFPSNPLTNIAIDKRIYVLDEKGKWLLATILEHTATAIKIKYNNYSDKFNEWIDIDKSSGRLSESVSVLSHPSKQPVWSSLFENLVLSAAHDEDWEMVDHILLQYIDTNNLKTLEKMLTHAKFCATPEAEKVSLLLQKLLEAARLAQATSQPECIVPPALTEEKINQARSPEQLIEDFQSAARSQLFEKAISILGSIETMTEAALLRIINSSALRNHYEGKFLSALSCFDLSNSVISSYLLKLNDKNSWNIINDYLTARAAQERTKTLLVNNVLLTALRKNDLQQVMNLTMQYKANLYAIDFPKQNLSLESIIPGLKCGIYSFGRWHLAEIKYVIGESIFFSTSNFRELEINYYDCPDSFIDEQQFANNQPQIIFSMVLATLRKAETHEEWNFVIHVVENLIANNLFTPNSIQKLFEESIAKYAVNAQQFLMSKGAKVSIDQLEKLISNKADLSIINSMSKENIEYIALLGMSNNQWSVLEKFVQLNVVDKNLLQPMLAAAILHADFTMYKILVNAGVNIADLNLTEISAYEYLYVIPEGLPNHKAYIDVETFFKSHSDLIASLDKTFGKITSEEDLIFVRGEFAKLNLPSAKMVYFQGMLNRILHFDVATIESFLRLEIPLNSAHLSTCLTMARAEKVSLLLKEDKDVDCSIEDLTKCMPYIARADEWDPICAYLTLREPNAEQLTEILSHTNEHSLIRILAICTKFPEELVRTALRATCAKALSWHWGTNLIINLNKHADFDGLNDCFDANGDSSHWRHITYLFSAIKKDSLNIRFPKKFFLHAMNNNECKYGFYVVDQYIANEPIAVNKDAILELRKYCEELTRLSNSETLSLWQTFDNAKGYTLKVKFSAVTNLIYILMGGKKASLYQLEIDFIKSKFSELLTKVANPEILPDELKPVQRTISVSL